MNALSTMLLIADTFVALCDEMPLKKVSISDIIERTGKNRKTFYYHFENKDCLIVDLPLRPRSGAQTPLPRKHARVRDRCDRLLRAVPLLHPAEVGRALARSRRVLRLRFAHVLEAKRNFYTRLSPTRTPTRCATTCTTCTCPRCWRHRPHLGEPLPAPGEHPVLGRVLHLRVSVLLHPQVRPARRRSADRAGRPFANIIHSSLEAQIKEAQLRRNL